jgi:hypothetical protein
MSKRSYNRRSDQEIIQELQGRIQEIEKRIESRTRTDSQVLKEMPKARRSLARFAQVCMDNQRNDLSNTILGFMATLENQAKDVPPSVQNAIRARIDRVENAEAF